ncbi:MAG: hypothetical protein ACU843_09245 [Gammaproteobacteria bacterium]
MTAGIPEEVRNARSEYHARHNFVRSVQHQAAERRRNPARPGKWLCNAQFCHVSLNGRPLHLNSDQLGERSNRSLVPMFARVFTARSGRLRHLEPQGGAFEFHD